MNTLVRSLRVVVPPAIYVVSAAVAYFVSWGPILLFWYLGLPEPAAMHVPGIGLLVVVAAAFGLYRVWAFHPALRADYREWLSRTPWTDSHSLPLGPVHVVWQDLVLLAVVQFLTWGHFARIRASDTVELADSPLIHPTVGLLLLPTLAFVVMRVSSIAVHCLATDAWEIAGWIVFGLGLLVVGFNQSAMVFPIAGGLLLLDQAGLRRSLRRVWTSSTQSENGFPGGRIGAHSTLGWPYRGVGQTNAAVLGEFGNSLASQVRGRDAAVLSGLIGWWLYVVLVVLNRLDPSLATDMQDWRRIGVTAAFALGAAMIRWGTYCVAYRPPISLWGRIRTGRWIIRGHDHVYLAPLATVVIGTGCDVVLGLWGVSPLVATPVAAAIVIWLSLVLGPSLMVWQLTGNHRLNPSAFNPPGK